MASNNAAGDAGATTPENNNMPIPSAIAQITPKIPVFWPDNVELWFAQLEAQFFLSGISDQRTKYSYVVSALDQRHAHEIMDILSKPLSATPYEDVKNELIHRLSISDEKKIRQVLLEEELSNRTHSQFLRYLQHLSSSTPVSDQLLKTLWLQRLPTHVQAILQAQTDLSSERLAVIADKILEVQPQTSSTLPTINTVACETGSESQLNLLTKQVENLTIQISKLVSFTMSTRNQRSSRSNNKKYNSSRSPTPNTALPRTCWYHRKYGVNAHRCVTPCVFPAENANDGH